MAIPTGIQLTCPTTAISSPTRASLLTGRNHHNVGMGLFPHKALSGEFPGYTGRLQPENGTVAEAPEVDTLDGGPDVDIVIQ